MPCLIVCCLLEAIPYHIWCEEVEVRSNEKQRGVRHFVLANGPRARAGGAHSNKKMAGKNYKHCLPVFIAECDGNKHFSPPNVHCDEIQWRRGKFCFFSLVRNSTDARCFVSQDNGSHTRHPAVFLCAESNALWIAFRGREDGFYIAVTDRGVLWAHIWARLREPLGDKVPVYPPWKQSWLSAKDDIDQKGEYGTTESVPPCCLWRISQST